MREELRPRPVFLADGHLDRAARIESNGERNRGIMIMKSRGMAHSNQVREFSLTDRGLVIADAYLGPSGILTGSARDPTKRRRRQP